MSRLARLYKTAQGVGWDNLPRRILQMARVRTGLLRKRLDPQRFSDEAFQNACSLSTDQHRQAWLQRAGRLIPPGATQALNAFANSPQWEQYVLRVCKQALDGHYPFFDAWSAQTGWPPDFRLDPVHNVRWDLEGHWLDGPDSLAGQADIKFVWEPSRLSPAFLLARQYAATRDETWAHALWQLFDAWVQQNPPQQSIAWACGQEITFRLIAMIFAAALTVESDAATPGRLRNLTRLAWQCARHLAVNINHARSQKNNHAVSEAVGLWTVGALMTELPSARRWAKRGRDILAAETARQIYADGSFVQHSLNYHRVLLDDLLWACAVARAAETPLPTAVLDQMARATRWLEQIVDPQTGNVPNYGANDGARVLQLSPCDYTDYRPVLQAAAWAALHRNALEPGPWDEKTLWLLGPPNTSKPPQNRKPHHAAPDGGYYLLRGPNSQAFTRCHAYRDRPSQADMLHLDLSCHGLNLLRDAGSYMYNAPQPWGAYFPSTAAHNTLQIDRKSQMTKGPRFLWFDWTRARTLAFRSDTTGRAGWFRGQHHGYKKRGVLHQRSILRIDDAYLILDDVLGKGTHTVELRWRLPQADWTRDQNHFHASLHDRSFALGLHAGTDAIIQILRGQTHPQPEGWESIYYGLKQPCPVLHVLQDNAQLPLRIVTVVAPATDLPELIDPGADDRPLRLAAQPDVPDLQALTGGCIRCEKVEPST